MLTPDQSRCQNSAVTARGPGSARRPTQNELVLFLLTPGNLVEMAPAYSDSKPNKIQLSSLSCVHAQSMQSPQNQWPSIPKLEIHKLL